MTEMIQFIAKRLQPYSPAYYETVVRGLTETAGRCEVFSRQNPKDVAAAVKLLASATRRSVKAICDALAEFPVAREVRYHRDSSTEHRYIFADGSEITVKVRRTQ